MLGQLLPILSSWQALAMGTVLLALLSFGAGYKVADNAAKADQLVSLQDAIAIQSKVAADLNDIAAKNASEAQAQQEKAATTQKRLSDVIDKNHAYSDCKLDDDGLRVLNDAVDNANTR